MWWRTTRKQFELNGNHGNQKAMHDIVTAGTIPGILAYQDGRPIAWCSLAPREEYASLNRSPILKPVDDEPVWSLVCFFVAKKHRGQGIARQVLSRAIQYAADQGAGIIEAYPTVPKSDPLPPVSSFMGVPSLFAAAGFVEIARPSQTRLIMRFTIECEHA
jgi:GNAT superfamily N-acetyltransferase